MKKTNAASNEVFQSHKERQCDVRSGRRTYFVAIDSRTILAGTCVGSWALIVRPSRINAADVERAARTESMISTR